jgi:hypothetical protein
MLDVEQPQPKTAGNQNDGQLNQEIRPQTDRLSGYADDAQERQIGAAYAPAFLRSRAFSGKPLEAQK